MSGDSEMRAFYSSLLQRTGQLTEIYGGGSLSMLVVMNDNNPAEAEAQDGGASYTLTDFDGPFYSNKTRTRLGLLVDKGVALDDSVCDKLGIPRPSSDVRMSSTID